MALQTAFADQQFIWRNTMTDGTLPFRNFSDNYKEKEKKQMKESELFDENKASLVKTVRKIQGKG